MRHARVLRLSAALGLAAVFGSGGCIHHHHYYNGAGPDCGPVPRGSVVRYGEVCDVPATGANGTSVATVDDGATRKASTDGPAATLVSEPTYGSAHRGRLAWRRPVNDAYAQTRVAGAVDDDATSR